MLRALLAATLLLAGSSFHLTDASAAEVAYRLPAETAFILNLDLQAVRKSEVGGRLLEVAGTEFMVRGRGYVRSIEDIEARRPRFLRPALTSRDIAASETLPADARSAFSTIARVVELSLFGRRSVEAEAWKNARAAYSLFAFGRSWA